MYGINLTSFLHTIQFYISQRLYKGTGILLQTVSLSQEPFKDKTLRALNFEERNKNCD